MGERVFRSIRKHCYGGSTSWGKRPAERRSRLIQRFPRKIWEVKPISSIFLAEAQLARYTTGHLRNDDKLLQVGEAGRFSGQFTINVYDETFLVTYCTPKAGVITYSVTAANYQSNPDYVYTPQKVKEPLIKSG